MYIEGIILDCLKRIKENRSIFGIYHLLTGKKSIQSVHDARIFRVEKYYGVYQTLSRHQFSNIINEMVESGMLEISEVDNFYYVTKLGEQQLKFFETTTLFHYLNGLSYSGKDNIFRERLYLLVQTYSNIQENNYSFIPIVDNQDATKWVKDFYRNNQHNNIALQLYHELYPLLNLIVKEEAELFVDRLSGYQYYGMSIDQLTIKYSLSKDDILLYLTGITHKLISLINKNKDAYLILSQLISDFNQKRFITNTANHTFELLKNQYSLHQIAQIRNLKLNTIYDHIVEIALYDRFFQIEPFVNKDEQEAIIAAVRKNKTLKLKIIKESCGSSISYFQIRLVLARMNELLPEGEIHV